MHIFNFGSGSVRSPFYSKIFNPTLSHAKFDLAKIWILSHTVYMKPSAAKRNIIAKLYVKKLKHKRL